MGIERVYIAGTVQGDRHGTAVADQGYREELPRLITRVFPHAECFDPAAEVLALLGTPGAHRAISDLASSQPPIIDLRSVPPFVHELRRSFLAMTREVSSSDLCIAYLPGSTPSMGTAMEMYQAHLTGVPVVTVTTMVSNLAVASVSSHVVKDIAALELLLEEVRDGQARISHRGP